MDERVHRDAEKWSNPEIPNPGFTTDRVDATGVDASDPFDRVDATSVDPSEADPFASDRLPWSRANPKNTTSLSAPATLAYMDRQS